MGSKSKIVKEICSVFPNADNFYDLFGGGFSVSHFMIKHMSKDYKEFHFNEIRPGVCDLIKDAISGKYNYNVFKPEFVDREVFNREKYNSAYIRFCWSFGNNGKNYLFGKDSEPKKKSFHNAVVFNRFDDYAKEVLGIDHFFDNQGITERRLFCRSKIASYYKLGYSSDDILNLEQLQRLQRLQQLQQLQQLQFYNKDYRDIFIKDNSIVYCDIPYKGTACYGNEFNHDEFFNWACEQKNPVFISEYEIIDKRFYKLKEIDKISLLCATNKRTVKKERLYVNKAGFIKILSNRTKNKY